MFGAFYIGRVQGIPIRLHWTMVLFLPYLALKLAGALGVHSTIWGWMAAVGLFASVLLHELGHSVVARGRGYPVRDIVLTPIGGVAFLTRAPRRANDELAIAIAGPGVSLVLAILFWLGATPLGHAGWLDAGVTVDLIGTINMSLLLFNLLPCFPMDGGRVFRAWRSKRVGRLQATVQAVRLGKILAWCFGLFGLFVGNWILVIIAFVVHQAAATELRQVQLQETAQRVGPGPSGGWGPFSFPPASGPPRESNVIEVDVSPPPYRR
jgi:stage IV sporulation protein FB